MDRDIILKWLNGNRNYHKGITLLKSINSELARPFISNIERKDLLFKTIKSLLVDQQPQTRTVKDAVRTIIVPSKTITQPAKQPTNPIAQEQKKIADKLYKEMSNTRALLFRLCPDQEQKFENEGKKVSERAELTKKVMDLQYQVDAAYEKYQFALEHSRLPEPIVKLPIEDKDLYKKISNAQKYISKYLNQKGKLSAEQQERLDNKRKELAYLESLYHDD